MTLFARCRDGHWNAFTARKTSPASGYYCGTPGCGLPFAEPVPFEEGATPAEMPLVKLIDKYPMYYRCGVGHTNFEPYDIERPRITALKCGEPACNAPLTRQWGSPAPGAETPLFKVLIAETPATLFSCFSGHTSFLNIWSAEGGYQNLACGHPGCLNPICAHRRRDSVVLLPEAVYPARQFNFAEILVSFSVALKNLDKPAASMSAGFDGVVTVEMESLEFFSTICKFSLHRFNGTARVALRWNQRVYAELTAPSFMTYGRMHPYCYPVDPDTGVRKTTAVAYEDIGLQLCKLSPDMVDTLLTVVLKVIKMSDNKQNDIASVANVMNGTLFVVDDHNRWNLLSLLAVLIGSAACETGRGVVGYVNVVAAFHHLKHDARSVWNSWASGATGNPIDASSAAIKAVYSPNYDLTGKEPKRNSVGFKGSEGLIKLHSGRMLSGALGSDSTAHAKAFDSYLKRDITLLARWRSPPYPILGGRDNRRDGETPEQTFERKILRYLRILFPQ